MKKGRRMLALLLSLALIVSMVLPSTNAFAEEVSDVIITNLKTNDMVDPVGVDVIPPTFSWQMQSNTVGQKQTAYSIMVAKNPEFTNIAWDSGKIQSEESVGIKYDGPELDAITTYYWKVTVWDKDDQKVSSEISTFETGLLGDNAWDGSEWIKVGDSTQPPAPEGKIDYTLDFDFQIANGAVGPVFEAKDGSNYLMWQFSESEGKLHYRPHTKKNGNFANIKDIDVTSLANGSAKDAQHVQIRVTNDAISTYLNGKLVEELSVNALNGMEPAGVDTLIGFRSSTGENGYLDNMIVTDYAASADGQVVKQYDFESDNPFTAGRIENGRLFTTTSGDVTGLEVGAGPEITDDHYVVEADMTCTTTAVSILFNAVNSGNFYMWQLNTKDSPGKVIFKPHIWKDGNYGTYDKTHFVDVTDIVTPEELKTTPVHMKVDVKGDQILTYLNDTLIDTFPVGEVSDQGTTGIAITRDSYLGFRSDGQEYGTVDNFKMTDYTDNSEGIVVYNYTFDDENPFLTGKVENGAFVVSGVGILLPPLGSPTFRKEFTPAGEVVSAKYYVTGLGVFDAFINGERVGARQADGSMVYDELKPGYTQPADRVFYYSYDVTDLLADGANTLTATMSTGWWGGAISGRYGSNSAYRAKLVLQYADGSSETIGTDTTWKTALQGPVISGDIYQGEIYNGGADTSYRLNGYDDSKWYFANKDTQFKGEIVSQIGPSIRVREDLELGVKSATVYDGAVNETANQYGNINVTGTYGADESFTLAPGQKAVIDFGQNFAGWDEITVEGAKGTVITMRHGEMLNDNDGLKSRGNDGPEGSIYTANLRSAAATGTYILSGEGVETYHSTHTFYGFRYSEISTTAPVTIHGLRGIVVTSVAEDTGTLTTSNQDVNQLISNVLWGQYSNYLSVPTDCPQRDERQGWTADTQVFSTAAAYNADSKGFLTKFMQDMRDSQADNGAYPDTAPRTAFGGTGQLGWADAGVIVPYNVYKMYGDKSIIEENYESMQKFMDVYMASCGPKGGGHSYGDWLSYEANDDGVKDLVGTAYYAWDAQMMSEMAAVLGKTEDAERYQQLYETEKKFFQDTFVNADGTLKRTEQTCYLMALKMDLLPSEESKEIVKQALLDNIKRNGNKLQTGFLGTATIMQTLSDIGATDVAYQLLLQRGNPSWLYSIDQGATTIWERWNSYTKETGFGDVGMNSFNHYSYGAVAEWMYGYMAGVMYDFDQPGFKHIILQPTPDQVIKTVDCSYNSAYGTIVSNWSYENGNFLYDATVPANTTATVYLPVEDDSTVTVNGKAPEQLTTEADGIRYVETKDGRAVFEAVAGSYSFAATVTEYCFINLTNADTAIPCNISINGGEFQSMPSIIKTEAGQPITIKAVPVNDVDYLFAGWTGDVASEDAEITLTPTADMNLTINFKWIGYDNLAQNKNVTSNSIYNSGATWQLSNLVDGVLNHLGGNNGYTSNSYNSPDVSKDPVWITVDLGEVTSFNQVKLYPRTDTLTGEGTTLNFPVHYQINVSDDGTNFTTIYETKDQKAPLWEPAVILFDEMQSAKYVQIKVFTLGDRDVAGSDMYRFQLSEFGIYDTTPPAPPVDKTELNEVIAEAADYEGKEADYTADSWKVFSDALAEANRVADDETADQAAVNTAAQALRDAIDQLTPAPPKPPVDTNKTILNKVIEKAEALLDTDEFNNAIQSVQDSFQAALTEAQGVAADDAATQEEVDAAWVSLMTEIHKLGLQQGNKDLLREHVELYSQLDLDLYIDGDAKDNFVAALEAAKAMLENNDAVQSEVDAADDALVAAAQALVKRGDKTTLQSVVDSTANYVEDHYAKGWAEFAAARDAANAVLENPNATQEEIDAATDALIEAMLNLRLKADKSLLNAVIAAAEGLDLSGYTRASVEAFEAALNEAKATAADESLSVDEQNQVTEAVNRLSEAVNNLKKADGSAANLSVNGDGSITGGSGSAKTGEATPIAMAMAALLLAGSAIVLKKRR